MRGESSEAVVGGIGCMVHTQSVGVKSTASPPLSAAVSQVSLAPSDLTTSDPDLVTSSAYSSAASSRPPSSSQVSLPATDLDLTPESPPPSGPPSRPASSSEFVTPELTLPDPEEYTAETVEFPTSPRVLKCGGRRSAGVCFLESDEVLTTNFLTPSYRTDESGTYDDSPKQGNGFEVGSDLEEDYFEEFHLPNSHENAFVRHKSFRRKVHLTPIDAPDAEKIEGLVRTGEFQRHGSIRRKMVPEEDPSIVLENYRNSSELDKRDQEAKSNMHNNVSETFAKDFREIENMLDDNEVGGVSDISGDLPREISENKLSVREVLANTSTPKSSSTNASSDSVGDYFITCTEENTSDENMSIEQSTLMKVRECLDFTKYKDIYVLSGRLQDILTAKEVEEILNNSERYSEYVNKEVIEALHNSLQEQHNSHNTGQFDSGISCPKKVIYVEGVEVDKEETSSIRAVIDDSDPQSEGAEANTSKRSSFISVDDELEDDTAFRFERRRSFRLGKEGKKEVEVEGVFVESKSQDIGLKKIRAPILDLNETTSEELNDIPNISNDEISQSLTKEPSESPAANSGTYFSESDESPASVVPDIVVTVAGENVIDEDDESMYLPECSQTTENCSTSIAGVSDTFTDVTCTEEKLRTEGYDILDQRRRISVAEDIFQAPDDDSISVASVFSQQSDCEDVEDDMNTFKTKVLTNLKYESDPHLEPLPLPPPQLIPELSAAEESFEERHWRSVVIGGVWYRIDMKVIAPYKKCVSHGGYLGQNRNAVIVISACQLPDRSRRDYNYVMDNLFLYVLSTLEQLIADDYILVYLAGGTPRSSMPSFHWLKRAYQMIDRKLRKNLKSLHVVHPTFWVRTLVAFSRPFISTKFYRKLTFVNNLTELAQMVPLDQLDIPDAVKQADFEMMIREKKKHLGKRRAFSLTAR